MFQKCPIAEKTKHSALKTSWRKLFLICRKSPKACVKKPQEAIFFLIMKPFVTLRGSLHLKITKIRILKYQNLLFS